MSGLFFVFLAVLLCLGLPASAQLVSSTQLLNLFSISDAALSLSVPGNQSTAYISTFDGNVYAVPLPVPSVLPPAVFSSASSAWGSIVVDPSQAMAYLLDLRNPAVYSLDLSSLVLTSIATFSSESPNSVTALTVDFSGTNPVAYVASQVNYCVYGVDLTEAGQDQNVTEAVYTDNDGLTFSALLVVPSLTGGSSTLFLTSPTAAQGVRTVVLSYIVVDGTTMLTEGNVQPLYSSATWYYPNSIAVDPTQTFLYVGDGGFNRGYIPSAPPAEFGFFYACNIAALDPTQTNVTTVFETDSIFLRGGLQLTADSSSVLFLATTTLQELVLPRYLTSIPPSTPSSTGGSLTPASSSTGVSSSPTSTAAVCIMLCAQPGTIDFPFCIAYSLSVTYNTTAVVGGASAAVTLLSGAGNRTFTTRFGTTIVTAVTLIPTFPTAAGPLLYLNGSLSSPLDRSGLLFALGSPVQQPGAGPLHPATQLNLYYQNGVLQEGGSSLTDSYGQAFVATVPGFSSIMMGAANINSLAMQYATCGAPMTFSNGLTVITQPSVSNGGTRISYSYSISDGVTYSVQTFLSVTAETFFAYLSDSLSNQYQRLVAFTGNRTYTHIPSGYTLTSQVTALANVSTASQRWYPYALLSARPGVYSVTTAPFLDGNGIAFTISPAAPALGLGLGTPTYNTVSTRILTNNTADTAVLSEGPLATNPPAFRLQRQAYSFSF